MKTITILVPGFLGLAVGAVSFLLIGSGTSFTEEALPNNVVRAEASEDQVDHSRHRHPEGPGDETGAVEADGQTGENGDHDHESDSSKNGGEHPVEASSEHDHTDKDGHTDDETGHTEDEDHENHDEHEDPSSVDLTPKQMETFDVRTTTVSGGPIAVTIERPAEVLYDENALAHVVPRVAGIARTIDAAEGDRVIEGEVLAVLESRELADTKAAYLASLERLALAEENFARAEALIDKRIVSERTHLAAKTDYAEARINLRSARQKLLALGIGRNRLKEISEEADADLTEYVMRAPLSGTVVTRHLTRGESVPTSREAFVIADVSTVWIDISIYAHDLELVEAGQQVTIVTDGGQEIEGAVAFVTPNVSEETRTANARVVLANTPMQLRPGMFVTARIAVVEEPAEVRVPITALQTHESRDVVFVKDKAGQLKLRPVSLGQRNSDFVEVLAGLTPGDTVVTNGAFVVKSQLDKTGFDDGHNH